jgi:predicted DNA-binding protein (MmcQ/YjbR family)
VADDQSDDPILAAVARACLALPEVTCEHMGQHAGFKVRKRTFAWFLNDHHGDGIVSIACKTALGENVELARREPARFYLSAYLGHQGWIALRLDRGKVDWDEVAELVAASYCLVAPKKLVAMVAAQR